MGNKQFIIILNEIGEVFISEYDQNICDCPEGFLEILNEERNLDLTENNCNWHIVQEEVVVKYL